MDLTTNGYVANSVYDNIRGMGTGAAFDMDAHGYEQTQSIKDQATLLNLYQDNKGERRSDRIDDKICQNELMGQAQTSAVLQKISDCCCETKNGLTALNGKIDTNAANAKNDILSFENRMLERAASEKALALNSYTFGMTPVAHINCLGK